MNKITVNEVESNEMAKCPFCDKELDKIDKITPEWGKPTIYRCFYCKKLLHIAA